MKAVSFKCSPKTVYICHYSNLMTVSSRFKLLLQCGQQNFIFIWFVCVLFSVLFKFNYFLSFNFVLTDLSSTFSNLFLTFVSNHHPAHWLPKITKIHPNYHQNKKKVGSPRDQNHLINLTSYRIVHHARKFTTSETDVSHPSFVHTPSRDEFLTIEATN